MSSKFQIILLVVFGAFIIVAVIVFSRSKGTAVATTQITIWGSMPAFDFNNLLINSGLSNDEKTQYSYVEEPPAVIDADFTEALAEGRGPDIILLPQDKLIKNRNKILLIPAANASPADLESAFIDEAVLLENPGGLYGIPLYVDPLVLYWNKDLVSSASFAKPPTFWDEIYDYTSKLTQRDNAGNILKSTIALGESKNIPNAKSILSLLMLQAGNPITGYVGNSLHAVMNENFNMPTSPASSALDFYTQFANPAKPFYSWNRSLVSADTAFTGGQSAFYIGFASELPLLRAKNPTLNLGVSSVPQSRVSGKSLTFGKLYSLSIVKSSKNAGTAMSSILTLVSQTSAAALAKNTALLPARRGLLSVKQADSIGAAFYTAALQSRGWLDPEDIKSDALFKDMIDSVTSGRKSVSETITSGNQSLDALIK